MWSGGSGGPGGCLGGKQVRVGGGCEVMLFKLTVKHIQVVSQLLSPCRAGGGTGSS